MREFNDEFKLTKYKMLAFCVIKPPKSSDNTSGRDNSAYHDAGSIAQFGSYRQ